MIAPSQLPITEPPLLRITTTAVPTHTSALANPWVRQVAAAMAMSITVKTGRPIAPRWRSNTTIPHPNIPRDGTTQAAGAPIIAAHQTPASPTSLIAIRN